MSPLPGISPPAARSIVVAVLDSGHDILHPDLWAKNSGTGRNFVNNDELAQDDLGHGTAVAGIIGAVSNNGIGVAGLSWGAKIMPVKVCGATTGCPFDAILNGIVWAVNGNAKIINMSLGQSVSSSGAMMMQDIINYAHNAGVIVVAAAGNHNEYLDPSDSEYYIPAELNHIVVVGATGRSDTRCVSTTSDCDWQSPSASARGPQLDIMAPGSADIWTTDIRGVAGLAPGDYVANFAGTSAAAPHVSGTIALMLSVNPSLNPDQVEIILKDTAIDLGAAGRDDLYGDGRIDVHAAVLAAYTTGSTGQGATTRVSVSTDGAPGSSHSGPSTLSGDGRYVAFESGASNLVPGDTNGIRDIFVRDRLTGVTTRVSVSTDRVQGDSDSMSPAISEDGRYVVFVSGASTLVPNDMTGGPNVFVHDRATGQTSLVSVSSEGMQGIGSLNSGPPSISSDGRYVAFSSFASYLVLNDTNNTADVFVHDRLTGETTRVSVSTDGVQGNAYSYLPALSGDGRYVAFVSPASNLVPDDTNASLDIFVHDRETGETSLASVSSAGAPANGPSVIPTLSGNGHYVAFVSYASNLVANDTNNSGDIFVYDRLTGQTTRVSVTDDGVQGNSGSYSPTLSGDGRYVAFSSWDSNLVPNDTNNRSDIFVHDRLTGQTSLVSVNSEDVQGNSDSTSPTLSKDGRYVAFDSWADNLVPLDTQGWSDVFVHDRQGVSPGRVFIQSLRIEHQSVANYQWVPVPESGTYAGNTVRITADLINDADADLTATIRFGSIACGVDADDETLMRKEVISLSTVEATPVLHEQDSSALAWFPGGTPPNSFLICVSVEVGGVIVDRELQLLKILPRPVVLIHGFPGTSAATWDFFKALLSGAGTGAPDWIGYAVGDGQYPGTLNVGSLTAPLEPTNTIAQNALEIARYIDALRRDKNAWHVDLVAHSMGGLIARQYIHRSMPTLLPDNRPLVGHLVMMGTPNGGACYAIPFAWLPMFQPAVSQLTPGYMREAFNPSVTERHGIPFYGLAGISTLTCLARGDGTVAESSVLAIPLVNSGPSVSLHAAMAFSYFDFLAVKNWLTGAASDGSVTASVPALQSEAALAHASQLLTTKTLLVPANSDVTEIINVPAALEGSLLTVSLFGPYVDSALLDPAAAVVDSINSTDELAGEPFRSLYANDPAAGAWTLQLNNPSSEPITLLLSIMLEGDPISVTLNVGEPDPDDQVPLTATVTDNGSPVVGATVSVLTRSLDGAETTMSLLDDGAHADGAANDGVYGGRTETLPPGLNTVSVSAQTAAFSRQAVGYVDIAVDNAPPAAQDDTATTPEGTPVFIDVLANDSDDQAMELLSISSVTLPASGQVINERNGITYIPSEGFQGVTTFEYTVEDPYGGTGTAAVQVVVGMQVTATVTLQGRSSPPDQTWEAMLYVNVTPSSGGATVFDGDVTTDQNGQFTFSGLPLGSSDLRQGFTYPGERRGSDAASWSQ
ncbi:MAG: alpha/beta fold hydrolase [Chloroflexi bacterium]|nr:alpha/beta fold hydrolase [Chloroflexota bacterium]